MPFSFFVVSLIDNREAAEELNAFLGNHRVVHVERRWIEQGSQSAWAFCIEYIESRGERGAIPKSGLSRNRIDYKTILSSEEFAIFSLLRELRKELPQQEAVPVYALFNNEQLAQMVQRRCSTKTDLLGIEGIGEARVDKYSERLLATLAKFPRSGPEREVP